MFPLGPLSPLLVALAHPGRSEAETDRVQAGSIRTAWAGSADEEHPQERREGEVLQVGATSHIFRDLECLRPHPSRFMPCVSFMPCAPFMPRFLGLLTKQEKVPCARPPILVDVAAVRIHHQ